MQPVPVPVSAGAAVPDGQQTSSALGGKPASRRMKILSIEFLSLLFRDRLACINFYTQLENTSRQPPGSLEQSVPSVAEIEAELAGGPGYGDLKVGFDSVIASK